MMPEGEHTHQLNMRDLLERVQDHLYSPSSKLVPDKQSRLYKDVVAALAKLESHETEVARLREENERLLKRWMKTFEGK